MRNEIEKQSRYMTGFDEKLTDWTANARIHIRPDFEDVIWDIRKEMKDDVVVKPISMLEYKKVVFQDIVGDMSDYYHIKTEKEYELGFQPTDEELIHNRFLQGANRGMKITKALSKAMSDIDRDYFSSKLDYFHKLPYENETYTITANPSKMLDLYYEIETCISPYGCNSHGILYYLLSPYIYVVYSDKSACRMLVVADHDRKRVFLGHVYGPNNPMMPVAVAKYFANKGYEFLSNPFIHFDTIEEFYLDGQGSMSNAVVEGLGGKFIGNTEWKVRGSVNLLKRTDWMTFKDDAISGSKNTTYFGEKVITNERIWSNNGVILYTDQFECRCCGEIYETGFQSDYDDMCKDCCDAYVRCDECGEYIDIYTDNFNAEYCLCEACAKEFLNECVECGEQYMYGESENDELCLTCSMKIEEAAKAAEEE